MEQPRSAGRPTGEDGKLSNRVLSVRLPKKADDLIWRLSSAERAKLARDAIVASLNNYVDKNKKGC